MATLNFTVPTLPSNKPVAVLLPKDSRSVVNSLVKLDGSHSYDPDGFSLTYSWSFSEVPIGSGVGLHGFTQVNPGDNSIVRFAPDVPGHYRVSLTVSNGTYTSDPTYTEIDIVLIEVPHGDGFVPDASFIWNYLSDFWNLVEGKDRLESFWSAAIQLVSSELLKLYQADYNKSIRDAQSLFQRKWVEIRSKIDLYSKYDLKFVLTDDAAGLSGDTTYSGSPKPDLVNQLTVPTSEYDFSNLGGGELLTVNKNYSAFLRSSTSGTSSTFYGDSFSFPEGKTSLPWRISSSIKSSDLDFEDLGVEEGDLLEVEITRTDIGLSTRIKLSVTGASSYRAGAVFNSEPLIDGIAAGGFTDDMILQMAEDLKVDGVTQTSSSLSYSGDALEVKNVLTSLKFKREYYHKELSQFDEINVGPFSVTIKPVKLIRNSRVKIDSDIVSIPTLQEYIKQPTIVEDGGKVYQLSEGKLTELDHLPRATFENLDYVVDSGTDVQVSINTTASSNIVNIPYGDLLDRSIKEGDTLYIPAGQNRGSYTITEIVDPSNLKTSSPMKEAENFVRATIIRKHAGAYVRFVNGINTTKLPSPDSWWAELVFVDNSKNIEANFGRLVGVRLDDLVAQEVELPYSAVVSGLMYALSRGPTSDNLKLGAHILLGLPFATKQGIVKQIDPVFRKDAAGVPKFGRIVIEETRPSGEKTGRTSIYLYPLGAQILNPTTGEYEAQDPDLSGLAINPDTGKEYEVGDFVKQFAPLSKGVELGDYKSNPEWFSTSETASRFHTFKLKANFDMFGTSEIALAKDFANKVKPHHTKMFVLAQKMAADIITIDDVFSGGVLKTYLFDTGASSFPAAVNSTYQGSTFVKNGIMYQAVVRGNDLVSTQGSSILESQSYTPIGPDRLYESNFPLINFNTVPGLLQILDGPNKGWYEITASNDTYFTLAGNSSTKTLSTYSGQSYIAYSPLINPIFTTTCSVVNGSTTVTISEGSYNSGVSPGDRVQLYSPGYVSRYYRVVSISPWSASKTMEVTPAIQDATGSYTLIVTRDQIRTKYVQALDPISQPFTATGGIANPWTALTSSHGAVYDVEKGDILKTASESYQILDVDGTNGQVYLNPPLNGAFVTAAAGIQKPAPIMSSTPITTSTSEKIIPDKITIIFRSYSLGTPRNDLLTTAGSNVVTTVSLEDFTLLGVKAGDFLVIEQGADSSIDYGYGYGIIPIAEVTNTQLKLTRNLTATNASPGIPFGIMRMV